MTEKANALEPTSDPVTGASAPDPVGPIGPVNGRGMEPEDVPGNTGPLCDDPACPWNRTLPQWEGLRHWHESGAVRLIQL